MELTSALGLLALALFVGTYGTIIGAGGGFVLIPALVLIFDLEGARAVGTGAVALAVIGLTGARAYDRGGKVARPVAAWFSLGSVPVAFGASSLLAKRIDGQVFITVLGLLLISLAVIVVAVPPLEEAPDRAAAPVRRGALVTGGTLVGAMSGTFSVGGGLLTVPFISRLQRLGPHRAAATTSATAMASSLAGATGHFVAGNVVWPKALVLVVGAFIGSNVGARIAGTLAPRTMLVLLASGLVAAGVPLLLRA